MRALPLLLLLTGCLDYARVDYVIDLRSGRATITYQDLTGDGQQDFAALVTNLVPGNSFEAEFPKATVLRREVVPKDGRLDVEIELQLEDPSQAGVRAWDHKRPYRLCPPEDASFAETNATYRDADGCVIWEKGTKVLRAVAITRGPREGESLLPYFQRWEAEGRPELSPPAPPEGASGLEE